MAQSDRFFDGQGLEISSSQGIEPSTKLFLIKVRLRRRPRPPRPPAPGLSQRPRQPPRVPQVFLSEVTEIWNFLGFHFCSFLVPTTICRTP